MVSALLVLCHVVDSLFTTHESRWNPVIISLSLFLSSLKHSSDAALLPFRFRFFVFVVPGFSVLMASASLHTAQHLFLSTLSLHTHPAGRHSNTKSVWCLVKQPSSKSLFSFSVFSILQFSHPTKNV